MENASIHGTRRWIRLPNVNQLKYANEYVGEWNYNGHNKNKWIHVKSIGYILQGNARSICTHIYDIYKLHRFIQNAQPPSSHVVVSNAGLFQT